MKLSNLLSIFAIALVCLFSLQAFWLYNTYRLQLRNVEDSINSLFYQTIEKELDKRFLELEIKAKHYLAEADMRVDSFNVNYGRMKSNSAVSQQYAMLQQLMENYNIPFNMIAIDSIFHLLLQSNQYPFLYRIDYINSTDTILETAGQDINKGFRTTVLPIVNDEKIYAVVKITAPVVFRKMLAILTVSILVFFFIIACLIYEIKVFIDQHHIIKLRENFTHALTHDMKTPLSTIHSILVQQEKEIINENPDSAQQKLNTIAIEQTLNLQAIVNRILTLAYIKNKQLSLKKQDVDLQTMIQSLIDKFTVKSGKSIVFQTFYDLKSDTVYADPFYLDNAISNLIDNAIKYSGDSVKIAIECVTEEKYINIGVKDDGFGISSSDQLKIFKQFERGAEIKRDRISGFGIGLNYVQQIIEAHEGTVTVLSQEGIGSEFIITLPVRYSFL